MVPRNKFKIAGSIFDLDLSVENGSDKGHTLLTQYHHLSAIHHSIEIESHRRVESTRRRC